MTFDEAMVLTHTRSAELLLSDIEARVLWDALHSLPDRATVIEIGCHWGRSSSLIAQVAKEKRFDLIFIDPYNGFADHAAEWMRMMVTIGVPFRFECRRSQDVAVPPCSDLVYIDGDHEEEPVYQDCEMYLSRVRNGGSALVHDYLRDSLQGVTDAVNRYMQRNPGWSHLGTWDHMGGWTKG